MRGSRFQSGVRRLSLGLAAVLVLLAGCQSNGPRSTSGPASSGVRAMQHPLLTGIPIPDGFQLDDKNSSHSSSGNFRLAKCVFTGSLRPVKAVEFYKEYMPAGGWTFRTESFDQGTYDERYESDREECNIRISHHMLHTRIMIEVSPKPVGSPEMPRRNQPPSPTP